MKIDDLLILNDRKENQLFNALAFRNTRPDEIWKKAFDEYNQSNPSLSIGCLPCYGKVLRWIISQNEEKILMHKLEKMCIESLSPEEFEKFESVKKNLFLTRQKLKA